MPPKRSIPETGGADINTPQTFARGFSRIQAKMPEEHSATLPDI
jgi:hypothetical protein